MKPYLSDLPQGTWFPPSARPLGAIRIDPHGEESRAALHCAGQYWDSLAGSATGGAVVLYLLSPLPLCTHIYVDRLSKTPSTKQTVSSDMLGYQSPKKFPPWRVPSGAQAMRAWLMQSWDVPAACDSMAVIVNSAVVNKKALLSASPDLSRASQWPLQNEQPASLQEAAPQLQRQTACPQVTFPSHHHSNTVGSRRLALTLQTHPFKKIFLITFSTPLKGAKKA